MDTNQLIKWLWRYYTCEEIFIDYTNNFNSSERFFDRAAMLQGTICIIGGSEQYDLSTYKK